MNTKLIEDLEQELAAHSAALEKAAELCEAQAARIKELEAENSEAGDHVGRAEMEAAAMVSALKYIVNLSNGWNLDGSTGPGMIAGVRMSWETLARLAMDCARSAVSVEHQRFAEPVVCQSTGEVFTRAWDAPSKSQRTADEKADGKPDGQEENSVLTQPDIV